MKNKKNKMQILIIVLIILFIGWIAYGYFSVRNVEQLNYKILDDSKEYEIRLIDEHIIAETNLKGTFQSGGNDAFRIIAGYIFGNNKKKQKIAMTTPVIQEESEKIAMTTPVIIDDETKDSKFSFVMPSEYTLDTLPEPIDSRVKLVKVEPYKVAVLRFSGFFRDNNYKKHKEELINYLERDNLRFSRIISAGYNPPWTPPFMTRLEVWAVLEEK